MKETDLVPNENEKEKQNGICEYWICIGLAIFFIICMIFDIEPSRNYHYGNLDQLYALIDYHVNYAIGAFVMLVAAGIMFFKSHYKIKEKADKK